MVYKTCLSIIVYTLLEHQPSYLIVAFLSPRQDHLLLFFGDLFRFFVDLASFLQLYNVRVCCSRYETSRFPWTMVLLSAVHVWRRVTSARRLSPQQCWHHTSWSLLAPMDLSGRLATYSTVLKGLYALFFNIVLSLMLSC